MTLAEKLTEGLSTKTVFTVFGIGVDESTVVSWLVMAAITLVCFILTRKLRVDKISKRQAAAEYIVSKLEAIVGGMVGERGRAYVPYLATVLLYLGVSNIMGVFGFKPPTKALNVTAALALMSIILVQAAGIRARGFAGWLRAFRQPMAIVLPFNILDLFTRPLSLCMRLFGNILGAFIVMELIKLVVPAIIPAALSLYFDFFDGILQAYVFVFLTAMYIREAVETE